MRKNGGSIIVVSSIQGTRVFSQMGASAYAVTKAGQVAFSRMMALELASDGIRVNTICPGSIRTKIRDNTVVRNLEKIRIRRDFPDGAIPLTRGEAGTSGQVAEAIAFLASEASSHITGTEIVIDGAESLLF
jgi:NAD(P)-dependent dehydrogenase (short-subunit alcohol dehydrogenase family)